ncbi:MAG: hypothetical protein P9X27_02630 [Candidatus Kaelpia aquatica]|nr:hypothetical protein [Candidatus Kaelpia aquatica]
MDNKRKQGYILIALIVLMLTVFSYRFFYRSIDLEQYQSVGLGMDTEQVKAVLGSPVRVSKHYCSCHGASEVWRYNIRFSLLAATTWFKSPGGGSMVVVDKVWGFISQ